MTHLTPNLVAVQVPEEAHEFDVIHGHPSYLYYCTNEGHHSGMEISLPEGSYRFLGICTSSGPEFDAAPHVKWTKDNHQNGRIWYLNYKTKQYVLVKPIDSFLSIMQSAGCYFENPLGNDPDEILKYSPEKYLEWTTAQSQSSPKWAILEKL